MRLIDADEVFCSDCEWKDQCENVVCDVKTMPTIDPESLRVQGRWVFAGDGIVECTVCSETYDVNVLPRNYCPNCGAKMKGSENNA